MMYGWMDDAILRPFHQYFSHVKKWEGGIERLYAMESRLILKRFPPPERIELGTTRSASKRLTHQGTGDPDVARTCAKKKDSA